MDFKAVEPARAGDPLGYSLKTLCDFMRKLWQTVPDVTQDQCLSVCKANRECRGFYWVDDKCYLKRRLDEDRNVRKPGENGVLVKVMEFRRIQNQDAEKNDIRHFPDTDEGGCQNLCTSSLIEGCVAYYWVNNNCWLKHHIGTLQPKDHEPGVFGIRLC